MEPVSTINMDFLSSKNCAREHTTRKSVKIHLGAKGPNCATKDTLKFVKDTLLIKDANSEVNALTNIQWSL